VEVITTAIQQAGLRVIRSLVTSSLRSS
jgi:hypothetical protein